MPFSRRILILLDADGERRGFITDGAPLSATIQGDTQPVGFGPGLDVSTLPMRAASLMGETAGDAGSISATLALDAFDLFALRDRVPVQRVAVRAWLMPVDDDGYPVFADGTPSALMPEYEIFRGVIRSPVWDLDANTLQFTAAPDLRLLDVQFPPTVITAERFPGAPSTSSSTAVPVIYGTVAGLPLYPVSDVAGDPIRMLIAGHPIVSTTVDVYEMVNGLPLLVGTLPVLYALDSIGGSYAYVEFPMGSYVSSGLFAETVTGWRDPAGACIQGLGDVLLHLWETYGNERFFDIDRTRCYAARDQLNRYAVGLVFNQQDAGSGLIRILQGRLEGQFPVAFGLTGGRIGWDCTRIPTDDEIPGMVIGSLTYGLDAHQREGPVEGDAGAVVTSIQAHAGLDGAQSGSVTTITADRTNMGAFRGAVARWGESPLQRLDLPDSADAWSVVTDFAVAQSEVRETITYGGLNGHWFDAPLFFVVTVTDEAARYDDEPMLLTAVQPQLDGTCAVRLLRIRGV